MRKMIFLKNLLFYLAFFVVSQNSLAATHLQILTKAYPYGLVGDDYGLLTIDDLAFNACIAVPEPLSNDSGGYPYWQCFNTHEVTFECDHGGEQEPGKPIEAFIVLVIRQKDKKEEYLARRPMDLRACSGYEKDWKRLSKGEKHVCISGELIRFDIDEKRDYDVHWLFDKFKTQKGCVAYFNDHCDTKRKRSPCEGAKDK